MATRLNRWGNSIGLRLPAYVLERTGLRAGDHVFVRLTDAGDIVIRPAKQRPVPEEYEAGDAPPLAKEKPPSEYEILAGW